MLFSVFIPPMFPVQIYIVVRASSRGSITCSLCLTSGQIVVQSLLGLLFGWGIGCAGMKAALAVRSNLYVESTLQNVASRSVTRSDHVSHAQFDLTSCAVSEVL
jgi:hypothetical protein